MLRFLLFYGKNASQENNNKMKILEATPKDIPLIQDLAKRSWEMAYSKILSPGQISYMMAEMYSEKKFHPKWKILTGDTF